MLGKHPTVKWWNCRKDVSLPHTPLLFPLVPLYSSQAGDNSSPLMSPSVSFLWRVLSWLSDDLVLSDSWLSVYLADCNDLRTSLLAYPAPQGWTSFRAKLTYQGLEANPFPTASPYLYSGGMQDSHKPLGKQCIKYLATLFCHLQPLHTHPLRGREASPTHRTSR